jgi:hypothetical protein
MLLLVEVTAEAVASSYVEAGHFGRGPRSAAGGSSAGGRSRSPGAGGVRCRIQWGERGEDDPLYRPRWADQPVDVIELAGHEVALEQAGSAPLAGLEDSLARGVRGGRK